MKDRCKHWAHAIALVLSTALAQGAFAEVTLSVKGGSAGKALSDAGLARAERNAWAGTIVAFAGSADGGVSDGLPGANSPFAEALLRYLEAPLDVGLMVRWVRDAVLESTSGRQEPVAHVSLSARSVYLAADPASHAATRTVTEGTEQQAGTPRVALTIGNGAYESHVSLANPVDDAEAVASALERLGFEVVRLANADRTTLDRGILEFREKAANAEITAVYYSGHGIRIAGDHYLVPVDLPIASPGEMRAIGVPLDRVMHAAEPASVLRLIMLDAMFGELGKPNVR